MERIESKQFRDYSQQIDDITFFQGDTITIPFQFIDFDGDVVTLRKTPKSQTYVKWLLCPFGQYQNPLIELKSDSVNSPSGDVYIDDETNIVYVHIDDFEHFLHNCLDNGTIDMNIGREMLLVLEEYNNLFGGVLL